MDRLDDIRLALGELFDEEFLEAAYLKLLGRPADPGGWEIHLKALREGQLSRFDVMASMLLSGEGRKRWPELPSDLTQQIKRRARWRETGFGFRARTRRLLRSLARLPAAMQTSRRSIGNLYRLVTRQRRDFTAHVQHLEALVRQAEQAKNELLDRANQERQRLENIIEKLRRDLFSVQHTLVSLSGEAVRRASPAADAPLAALDSFYLAFEDRFRGPETLIRERQQEYFPVVERLCTHSGPLSVLDIGCGRGEWLQLLKERGDIAKGIDSNIAMVEHCKSAGLDATHSDGIAYLEAQPEESLHIITAFHVIEHMPFAAMLRLFDACHRVLKRGGLIIFETPNPENILVGACHFYTDPTHIRPLPPALVQFMAEERGFTAIETLRLHPSRDADMSSELAHVLSRFTMAHDYAVVARK